MKTQRERRERESESARAVREEEDEGSERERVVCGKITITGADSCRILTGPFVTSFYGIWGGWHAEGAKNR